MEYPGITAERTIADTLLFNQSWLIVALLYASIVLSLSAIAWMLFMHGEAPQRTVKHQWRLSISKLFRREPLRMQALTSTILVLMLLHTGASVFAYYPFEASTTPVSPPLILDYPTYTYTSTNLTRTSRGAITYTDFESYPLSGWASGGGNWSVVLGANRTSAVISANVSASPLMVTSSRFTRINNTDGKPYYVRLTLSPLSSLGRLYANISLINSTSATTVNITIVNGVVVSDATSWIAIQPGATINATFSAYFPSTGQSAMLYMLLEYSTLPGGQGVCVYYPIELRLRTSS